MLALGGRKQGSSSIQKIRKSRKVNTPIEVPGTPRDSYIATSHRNGLWTKQALRSYFQGSWFSLLHSFSSYRTLHLRTEPLHSVDICTSPSSGLLFTMRFSATAPLCVFLLGVLCLCACSSALQDAGMSSSLPRSVLSLIRAEKLCDRETTSDTVT
jgi:hypothetical protein